MKFWKPTLITTLLFFSVVTVLLYVACERNPCDNVTCFNGGSCNSGLCRCPTGYEGPQCQTLSTARYVGYYAGTIQCDNLSAVIDSCQITTDTSGILNVDVYMQSIAPKVLHGVVSSNVSTYSILIKNNDTTVTDTSFYYRNFTITLQSDMTLKIYTYTDEETPTDTVHSKCTFLATKYK